jgi:hypothetical protein
VTAEAIPAFFKYVHMKLLSSLNEMATAHSAENIGTVQANANMAHFPASLFLKGIADESGADALSYPYQFLENVINFLMKGDGDVPDSPMIQYYGDYCRKINMENRYAKVPHFDTATAAKDWDGAFPILKGLQRGQMFKMYMEMTTAGPSQESIYSLINYVVASLEYEWAFFTSPAYVNGTTMVSTCLKPMMYEALPPACNIMFKSLTSSLNIQENVMEPPTRVLLRDADSAYALQILKNTGNAGGLAAAMLYSFWPTDSRTDSAKGTGKNLLNATLLDGDPDKHLSELFCGPRIYETTAPPWMSYLGENADNGAVGSVLESILKHIFYMKQYEQRRMDVTGVFNPYVTQGFPGVVFDTDGASASSYVGFIGHVLTVNHSLSKDRASTTVSLGFARTLQEDRDNPIPATLPEISTNITRNATNVQQIYTALLDTKTPAVDIATLCSEYEGVQVSSDNPQNNPTKAFQYIQRGIMGMSEYADFMPGVSLGEDVLSGEYLSSRWDETLVANLTTAANSKAHKSIFKTST